MSKPSILVIDDDESITLTVSRFLHAHGYRVVVANDGEDALTEARSGAYPIIISIEASTFPSGVCGEISP